MSDFEGLVAVVTGGASGIGAATASLLQGRGARLAVLDRSTDGAPDGVLTLRCDVTDTPAVDAAVTEVVERLGGLDVLVNNAGIGAVGAVKIRCGDDCGTAGIWAGSTKGRIPLVSEPAEAAGRVAPRKSSPR